MGAMMIVAVLLVGMLCGLVLALLLVLPRQMRSERQRCCYWIDVATARTRNAQARQELIKARQWVLRGIWPKDGGETRFDLVKEAAEDGGLREGGER